MLDQVRKEEVWRLILPYLRRPIPIPLSAPPRSALRQNTLCAAMATCRLFRDICEPLLYSEIATDRFGTMLSDSTIDSVTRRFAHTRRLYIEYLPKGRVPNYEQLLRHRNAWGAMGRSQADTDAVTFKEYNAELVDLMATLQVLNQIGVRNIFKRLESIAVSSIYGRDTDTYLRFDDHGDDIYKAALPTIGHERALDILLNQRAYLRGVQQQWKLFLRAANPRHFCSRDTAGVLNVDRVDWVSEGNLPRGECGLVFHFGPHIRFLPIVFGRSVVWASDAPLTADWSIPIENIGHFLVDDAEIRTSLDKRGKESEHAHVDLYCSTAYAVPLHPDSTELRLPPEATQRYVDEANAQILCEGYLEPMLERMLRQQFGWKNDTIRWMASCYTPICQACGSGVPGINAGEWLTGDFEARKLENEDGGARFGDDEPVPEDTTVWIDKEKGLQGIRI